MFISTVAKMLWKITKLTRMEPVPKAPTRQEHEAPVNVPVDPQLYCALTHEASKSGMSLHAFVAQKLKSLTPGGS